MHQKLYGSNMHVGRKILIIAHARKQINKMYFVAWTKSDLEEEHTACIFRFDTWFWYINLTDREVTDTELQPNNMNRGFYLSKSWKSLISSLKECRRPPL
jgi:hypothetical protein